MEPKPFLRLDEIHCFLAVSEHESFRRAAETLGTRQSSVSRAVLRLEDRLGVSLLERRSTGTKLTNAGRQFLSEVRPALAQLGQAQRAAMGAGRGDTGTVRVGLHSPPISKFVQTTVSMFLERHPEVRIDICDGSREEHIAAVRSHRLDIAFIPGTGLVQGCESAELWQERVYVALPGKHDLARRRRLDWPDIITEHFIVSRFSTGPEVRDCILRRTATYAIHPNIELKEACGETLMALVCLGQGITVVQASWAAVRFPGLVLRPLKAPQDILPYMAVWSAKNDNPALRRLVSLARALAR
ncbi:LysR family transcriptional regulator [Jiella pacifica]|uniref:LysR family transcriptional regulator n=1 Tax=Jiella pacifica TaxID=2696469 RepID=A0A6N9TAW2_9HYPH|nr:LysR family transcriptional regulator [Jiella pacifica]NDW06839.1 LysR family transcriptional regulator [Jiella pacifica]